MNADIVGAIVLGSVCIVLIICYTILKLKGKL